MKCANPECPRLDAEELNISVNVTETTEELDFEYCGNTEYGDCSDAIGTYCRGLCGAVYYPNATETVIRFSGIWELR
jgi:hypothetical protein